MLKCCRFLTLIFAISSKILKIMFEKCHYQTWRFNEKTRIKIFISRQSETKNITHDLS